MKLEKAGEGEVDWVGAAKGGFLEGVRLRYAGKDENSRARQGFWAEAIAEAGHSDDISLAKE